MYLYHYAISVMNKLAGFGSGDPMNVIICPSIHELRGGLKASLSNPSRGGRHGLGHFYDEEICGALRTLGNGTAGNIRIR